MTEEPNTPANQNNTNPTEDELGTFQKFILNLYDKVINGDIPGMDSADQLADKYRTGYASLEDAANALVRWQMGKCAADGFLTSLPGLIFLPATLPANVVSVLAFNIQMIATVARLGGYDLHDERIKTLVLICLTGESANAALGNFENTCDQINTKTLLRKINYLVGVKLFTKFSSKGIIQLGLAVPLIGGVIGAVSDGYWSNVVGTRAIETFIHNGQDGQDSAADSAADRAEVHLEDSLNHEQAHEE